ncbi:hypothetical protein Z968_05085 [Clostridium novyi A str. 4552]|uniref:DUF4179 domain-containing protein n=1 Tax=Clostridium novyi A str. 4552 TaxID=1444289 RepID=A0A0A0I9G1_CLONO|nr:hypothetical protein [Clostridium novyi]KGM96956.1 hypothetical protein Z968_05085 [Clostridium novyi A str. 4552]
MYKPKTITKKYKLLALILFVLLSIPFLITMFSPSSKSIFYNDITTPMKSNYTMKLNEVKQSDNTNILLDEVLLDLNAVYIKSRIWGDDKLIAIELNKTPNDKLPLFTFTDLWIGSSLKFSPSAKGNFKLAFNENKIINPMYLIFYLSSGKSVKFKIDDKTNVKSATQFVSINKTLKFDLGKKEPLYLKFTNLTVGLTYTKLEVNSNFYPKDVEITLTSNNKKVKYFSGGYAGGVMGNLWFDPVDSNSLIINVKNTKTSEEQSIPIKIS